VKGDIERRISIPREKYQERKKKEKKMVYGRRGKLSAGKDDVIKTCRGKSDEGESK